MRDGHPNKSRPRHSVSQNDHHRVILVSSAVKRQIASPRRRVSQVRSLGGDESHQSESEEEHDLEGYHPTHPRRTA